MRKRTATAGAAWRVLILAAGTSLLAYAPTAMAQSASAATATPQGGGETLSEVIVTARRKAENLQNVPVTVSPISGETIKKLNLTQFQDVALALSGLSLTRDALSSGGFPAPTLRGVTYDASATASPTVDIYYNEVPLSPIIAFNAMYDIGGIQLLRGPQGTLRGRSAPSGAITIATRQADTHEYGGYASGLMTDHQSVNFQGAVNVPIIKDVLGVRLSGLLDENQGDFVNSIHSNVEPHRRLASGRISVTFTPTDDFSAHLMYQTFQVKNRFFTPVFGPGAPGLLPAAPANYNGPPLTASQRVGVDDFPSRGLTQSDTVTANATWNVYGQALEYVGSFQQERTRSNSAGDNGNSLIGNTAFGDLRTRNKNWTQEIRLSSTGADNLIDYSVGYFHSETKGFTGGPIEAAALSGAFGSPFATPDPTILNRRYVLDALVDSGGSLRENSFYGNLTLHLGSRTEIAAGARKIDNRSDNKIETFLGGGFIALPPAAIGLPSCALAGFTETYPGACDVPLAAGTTPLIDASQRGESKPWVYNLSVRHRFTDEILGYATMGTSWRRGGSNITINNSDNDPTLAGLNFTPNETSRSYELGLKTEWLDKRLRVNVAAFRQNYKNLIFQIPSIPYVASNGVTRQVASTQINVGADAVVMGFDFDAAFQPMRNWSMSLGVSYADGHVDHDTVPCRDSNFDGVPDSGTPTLQQFDDRQQHIALCKSDQSVARAPLWNANFQTEYFFPINGAADGYIRGLLNYYPKNRNADAGNEVTDYALINLYVGVRSPTGAWDVGLFARNLANTGVQLRRDPGVINAALGSGASFGSTGYSLTTYTPPREIGVTVRYAFGGG